MRSRRTLFRGQERVLDSAEDVEEYLTSAFEVMQFLQTGVFTALRDGPRTIAQLAAAIGAKPDNLRIPLNVPVLAGLLKRHGETVANRPESQHFLAHGSPGYVGE